MIPNVNGQGSYYDGSDLRNYSSSNINSNDFAYRTAALQLQQSHPAYASAYQPSPTTSYLYTYQPPPAPTNASSMMPNISPRQPSLTAHTLSTLSAQQMYAEQAAVHQITTNPGYVQISEEELVKHQHSPPANLLNETKLPTQTPPSSNSPSPGSLTREAGASTRKRARGSYNCSRCGGQKKGHQCTTTQIGEEELRKLYDNIQQLKQQNAYLGEELAKRDELIASLRKEKENEKEPQHQQLLQLQRHTHPPPHHHQQHSKTKRKL